MRPLPGPQRRARRRARRAALLCGVLALVGATGCIDDTAKDAIRKISEGRDRRPDVLPRMLNEEAPFRYPPSLYDRQVQGNVTLRIFIDTTGRVWPESTVVAEASGYPALDSAAVRGSEALRFAPAARGGAPMGVRVLFPVFFRHPAAPALPGDSVLSKG